MLFFKSSVNRYGLGLSNELLFVIVTQGAAKLWPVKVGSPKRIMLCSPLECGLESSPGFFFDLQVWQVSHASHWAMMIKSGSLESPKPYLLVHNLKNSRIPLLTSLRMSWKVAIYYIKWVLMILNRTPL